MKRPLEQKLDACLARLAGGTDVEDVLAEYPEDADELRAALAASARMRELAPPPLQRRERKGKLLAIVAAHRRLVEATEGVVVEIKAGVPVGEIERHCPSALRSVVTAARYMCEVEPPWPSDERRRQDLERLRRLAARRRQARIEALPLRLRIAVGLDVCLSQLVCAARRVVAERNADQGYGSRRAEYDQAAGSAFGATATRAGGGSTGAGSYGLRLGVAAVPIAAAMTIALLATARMVVPAAASSVPGEPLYQIKRLGESAQLFMTFDPQQREDLRAQLAARRLGEMGLLRAEGLPVPERLLESWLLTSGGAGAAGGEPYADLTSEQRRLLADVLRGMEANEPGLGRRIAGAGDLLVRLEQDETAGAAVASPEGDGAADGQEPASADLRWSPRQQPRPLPGDDLGAVAGRSGGGEEQVENPSVGGAGEHTASAGDSGDVLGAVQVAPPDAAAGGGDGDPAGDPGGQAASAGGSEPSEPGASPAPGSGSGSEPPGAIAPPSAPGMGGGDPPPFVQPDPGPPQGSPEDPPPPGSGEAP